MIMGVPDSVILRGRIALMHCPPTSTQTEANGKAAMGRKSAVPAAWAAASAEIVDHFDDPALPNLLARALSTLIDFEYSVVFIYRGRANPIHIHDTFPTPQARAGLINYVKNTYVLNPLYNAYQCGLKTGVYRLRDLASEGLVNSASFRKYRICATSSEEIGYLTEGWPAGREELCIALELPGGECATHAVAQIVPRRVRGRRHRQFVAGDSVSVSRGPALLAPCPLGVSVECAGHGD